VKVYTSTSFTRSLASVVGAPIIAFAAFIVGLAVTTVVMSFWNSDVVYVLCFGLAFFGGLFVTNRVSRSLVSQDGDFAEPVVLRTLLFYFLAVVILSFVLVGIINDLRSQ
jgi:hypothetical protein